VTPRRRAPARTVRFSFAAIYSDRVDIRIAKGGLSILTQKSFELPADGTDAIFVMAKGRQVVVTVADAAGHPVVASKVRAVAAVFDPITAREDGAGKYTLVDLAEGSIVIEASVGGREYPVQHDTRTPVANIVVPDHGGAEVHWEFRLEAAAENLLRVVPVEASGPALNLFIQNSSEMTRGRMTIPALLPGDYDVWIEARAVDPMAEIPGAFHAVTKHMALAIRAGAMATLTLAP